MAFYRQSQPGRTVNPGDAVRDQHHPGRISDCSDDDRQDPLSGDLPVDEVEIEDICPLEGLS